MILTDSSFDHMKYVRLLLAVVLTTFYMNAHAQPGAEIEVDKPKKYENRTLRAEKTGSKKMTLPRRFYQNTTTHYNYYFNANQRLNEVIAAAKQGFKDDYSQLLPFYNYTLQTTAQNKTELDSIVYKCTAGILLHDLRNDWIDNMFLLLAKAYFFRNDMDSAALTLQYINYAFSPKENGGYQIPIGSNASNDQGEFSISTKEKNNVFKKVFTRPPSRNESFIWQIRTFIERNELPEAAGIIEILQSDPNFPKRLHTDLEEMKAYWFYKQNIYDSSARHLILALDNANGQEKPRWEYLAAQMYQLAGNKDTAVVYYNKAMQHTNDPVMDVYARLNALRISKSASKDYLQENIDALHKMAKKDKYEGYRDILYYASATIELERKNYKGAEEDLLKSVKYTANNPVQRSQAFLLLGDLSYDQKAYIEAHNYYDSLDATALAKQVDKERIALRQPALKIIADNKLIIKDQDSLQALAKMSPEEREALIKKQKKAEAKAKGVKESSNSAVSLSNNQPATELFATNDGKSGDFYFYNSSSKARGFSEFKTKWGDRPNVDNWRRQGAIDKMAPKFGDVDDVANDDASKDKGADTGNVSLGNTMPVTPDEVNKSNKSIIDAMLAIADAFMNKLEEYPAAIDVDEELLKRFPNADEKDQVLFNLIYAYEKTGDKAKADYYRNQLLSGYPDSKWSKLVKSGSTAKREIKGDSATRKYEEIYNLFIEGNFDSAKAEKQVADSLYGKTYWTPQLLFIEAIYYIKQRDDSTAITRLTELYALHSNSPLADKAKAMIDVLKRRSEIESYLTNLQVKREGDTTSAGDNANIPVSTTAGDQPKVITPVTPPKNGNDSTDMESVDTDDKDASDTTAAAPVKPEVKAAPVVEKGYTYLATDPHYVVVVLDKVDPVYVNEARNAFNRYNREKFYSQTIDIRGEKVDDRYNLVLEGTFPSADAAIDYIDKVKPVVASRIVPWLSADKYSFLIISEANLGVLKSSKDIDSYKHLLQRAVPGKF